MDENNEIRETTDMPQDEAVAETVEGHHKKKDKKRDKRQEELDNMTKQCAVYQDKYLRTLAEFDNFRKRTLREKAALYDEGFKAAVLGFLPAIDNFGRAVAAAAGDDAVSKGLTMIYRQILETLKSMGVQEIDAVGQTFDLDLHDAVMHVDDEGYGPGEIVEELQKGYRYKDKTIRHSMVKVAN